MSTKKKEATVNQDRPIMILEKRGSKKATSAEIQAKMEAGKVEVMKVVEGVPGAEKLAELIERGKKKGNLSSTELMDVLEDMDLESEQMDKIYDVLENLGIDTVGEDYIPSCPMTPSPLWRLWRRSARRRWLIPTPWWTPSAPMTRCVCTSRRSVR